MLILKDKVVAADDDLLSVDAAGNAVRDQILHARMTLLVAQTAARRLRDDRFGHGVRIMLLQAGSQTQHVRLIIAAEGHDLCNFRLGARERAGLIEDDRARIGHGLKEPPALDGQVIVTGLLHGREHRDRHRELERAGEIDHQHGQRLGHVPGQEPDQRRCTQTVRNELIGKVRCVILRCGLELFRLLDHADDTVVAAAAGALFHADGAVALFDDGTGVDIAALRFADGQRLARDGSLIDHRLAGNDLAVKRDHVAGMDHDPVADLNVCHRHKYGAGVCLFPDLVHIQGHGLCEIGNGLLVRPLVENVANAQQEHDRACRLEVLAQHRNGDRRCVQHRHLDLPVHQARHTGLDIRHGTRDRDQRAHRARNEQLLDAAPAQRCDKLVLKITIQGAAAVLRRERLLLGIGKGRERLCNRFPRPVVADHGVAGAVIDCRFCDAGDPIQVCLQNVRLLQRHGTLHCMHAHTAPGFMQDCAFHTYSAFSAVSSMTSACSAARFSLNALAPARTSPAISLTFVTTAMTSSFSRRAAAVV